MTEHPLKPHWTFSYQNYDNWEYVDIVHVYTVEQFWMAVDDTRPQHIPLPSTFMQVVGSLDRKRFVKPVNTVRSFSFRRGDIAMKWEDPNNNGSFTVDIPNITATQIDHIWEMLLLQAIGGIEYGDTLRALRVADKGKGKGNNCTVCIRLEAWCKHAEQGVQETLNGVLRDQGIDAVFKWKTFD